MTEPLRVLKYSSGKEKRELAKRMMRQRVAHAPQDDAAFGTERQAGCRHRGDKRGFGLDLVADGAHEMGEQTVAQKPGSGSPSLVRQEQHTKLLMLVERHRISANCTETLFGQDIACAIEDGESQISRLTPPD